MNPHRGKGITYDQLLRDIGQLREEKILALDLIEPPKIKPTFLTEQARNEISEAYQRGDKITDIAAGHKASTKAIYAVVREFGLPRRRA